MHDLLGSKLLRLFDLLQKILTSFVKSSAKVFFGQMCHCDMIGIREIRENPRILNLNVQYPW